MGLACSHAKGLREGEGAARGYSTWPRPRGLRGGRAGGAGVDGVAGGGGGLP